MNNAKSFHLAVLTFVLLIIGASVMARQFGGGEGPHFDLSWNTIDGGGGTSTGGDAGELSLDGTIGQADAGTLLTGAGFELSGGFWPGNVPLPDPCPSDINNDNLVNVQDLLLVIAAWGGCPNPVDCPADIAPAGPPMGDDLVNVQDLLAVIGAWGACP